MKGIKKVQRSFLSQASKSQSPSLVGRLEDVQPNNPCKYDVVCKRECLDYRKFNCQIYKFYKKYPNYEQLRIGSRMWA